MLFIRTCFALRCEKLYLALAEPVNCCVVLAIMGQWVYNLLIMAKYDNQISELKSLLPNSKNVLIALPAGADIDKFASGLALFLAFEVQDKQISIISDDTIRVAQAHLFGVDHIKNTVSSAGGGDLTIVLEGVVAPDGTVPALEKLDWHPDGNNLNLDFHAVSGQSFKPANITPKYGGSGFDLIFTIGAINLNTLGNIYSSNTQVFGGNIINIDNQSGNANFGKTNVVDASASSVSEIMADLIPSLGLPFDSDIASNLLAGIFEATESLSNQKVGADTYMAVAQCLRVGGRKPASVETSAGKPAASATQVPQTADSPQSSVTPSSSGLDLSALIPQTPPAQPQYISTQDFINPNINTKQSSKIVDSTTPSPEERPQMEGLNSADSIEVEPGWLTPKVFKGTSAG